MVTKHVSKTGDRMVIDIVAPGYDKTMVKASTAVKTGNCGKKVFELTFKGAYDRPTGATGKKVPRFAFDKVIDESWKIVIDDIPMDGDYNVDAIAWDMKNGVIRVSVPKTDAARGKALDATDGNINAVASDADAAADADAPESED